ncbi:MAG: hypothetical protein QXI45_01875 [Thermofilaceae archaeon]
MAENEIRVAWRPDEFKELVREFRGRIVRAEWGSASPSSKHYNAWVFPPEAPEDIRQRQAERGALAMRVEIMPIDQPWNNVYEWYTISDVRLSKWYYFIDALHRTGAPINTSGNTDEERLNSFCKSLIGMEFKWQEFDLPTIGGKIIKRLLLPVEYYGKFEVERPEVVEI